MSAMLNSPMMGWFRRPAKPPVMRKQSRRAAQPLVQDEIAPAEIAPSMPLAYAPDAPAVDADRILAATRDAAVDLAPIEWDGDKALAKRAEVAVADATSTLDG